MGARRRSVSSIALTNFKSVRQAEVELGDLTVVVGRNSAGKSTLIQSLLTLSQAINSEHRPGLIPLNGDLVRLGTFREVKNFRAGDSEPLVLAVATRIPWDSLLAQRLGRSVDGDDPDETNPEALDVCVTVTLMPFRGDSNESRAEIVELTSTAKPLPSDHQRGETLVVLEVSAEQEPRDALDLSRTKRGKQLMWSPWRIALTDRQFTTAGQRGQRLDAMELDGLLPGGVFAGTTVASSLLDRWWEVHEKRLADEIRAETAALRQFQGDERRAPAASHSAPRRAHRDVLNAFARISPVESLTQFDLEQMDMFIEQLEMRYSANQRGAIARSMVRLGYPKFVERTLQRIESDSSDEAVSAFPILIGTCWVRPRPVGWAVLDIGHDELRDALRDLQYLGPIRNPGWDPGPSIRNVGPAGEYAPTVLRARGADNVSVPLPFNDSALWETEEVKVADAVNLTLRFLDLAGEATVKDHGRFGVGFSIRQKGTHPDVDLTAVGVGVSQALPIVLQLVLSEPGQVVVVEQPELHLHPAMQLRMADLLLNYAMSGRQIIAETHSEHIVNRLRRRVVESPDQVQDAIQLQFAETDAEGDTVYRSSSIGADGTLSEDWPEGFFEVGSGEATEFLRALLSSKQVTDQ